MKDRNPKAESRRKSESRNLKAEDYGPQAPMSGCRVIWMSPFAVVRMSRRYVESSFGFRASDFLRISDFGFRILSCSLSLLAAQTLHAATTNPPDPDAIPPLLPPRGEIPPAFWEQNRLGVIIFGVLLLGLVCAAVWWLRRRRPAVIVPPEAEARQALEPLREQTEDGAVLSRISQILRRYVGAAFGLPPGEMTTTDFCRAIADHERLGLELSASLSDFLRQCDERKFAPAAPRPALGAAAQAFKFIELAEVRRAQLRQADEAQAAPLPARAYRGRSKA